MQLRDQTETHPQMLKRIIVMLLNIAGLAERSASYPAAARAFVLFILYRAEAYAWDYFTDIFEQHPESFGFYSGVSPEDALELADSFRKLAAAIQQTLIQDRIFRIWWGGEHQNAARNRERAGHGCRLADRLAGHATPLAALAVCLTVGSGFAPIPRLDTS